VRDVDLGLSYGLDPEVLHQHEDEVIKALTVLFTVTIPLTIVTSAFGMNVWFPGFNAVEGLYLALAIMLIPTIAIVIWLRRKKWL